MSFPMMTFPLRPSSRSTLPSIEASVSTFVVSRKAAAEGRGCVPLADEEPGAPRQVVRDGHDRIAVLVERLRVDDDLRAAVGLLRVHLAAGLGELRRALRVPRLEDLDDARKTVRDVGAGD